MNALLTAMAQVQGPVDRRVQRVYFFPDLDLSVPICPFLSRAFISRPVVWGTLDLHWFSSFPRFA